MTPSCRMVDAILERALKVWEGLGGASEAHGLADVVTTFGAPGTCAAGQPDLQGDFVTDLKAHHLWADGDDRASRLMAERHGFLDEDISIAIVVVVVQIGPTEARSMDCHLQLARGWAGDGSAFLTRRWW